MIFVSYVFPHIYFVEVEHFIKEFFFHDKADSLKKHQMVLSDKSVLAVALISRT